MTRPDRPAGAPYAAPVDRFPITPERWERTNAYIRALFAREDRVLAGLMDRAISAGLPSIDAGPESGRVLQLLAMITGARCAVEVGTLAGASAIWIARGLAPGGRLVSIDIEEKHQRIAAREAADAGVSARIDFRLGRGSELLPRLLREFGEGSVDLIFLDAERREYLPMMPAVRSLLRPRGVLVVDNALHASRWTADPHEPGEEVDTMDIFNRTMAEDPAFASTILPVGNGLLLGVRVADPRATG